MTTTEDLNASLEKLIELLGGQGGPLQPGTPGSGNGPGSGPIVLPTPTGEASTAARSRLTERARIANSYLIQQSVPPISHADVVEIEEMLPEIVAALAELRHRPTRKGEVEEIIGLAMKLLSERIDDPDVLADAEELLALLLADAEAGESGERWGPAIALTAPAVVGLVALGVAGVALGFAIGSAIEKQKDSKKDKTDTATAEGRSPETGVGGNGERQVVAGPGDLDGIPFPGRWPGGPDIPWPFPSPKVPQSGERSGGAASSVPTGDALEALLALYVRGDVRSAVVHLTPVLIGILGENETAGAQFEGLVSTDELAQMLRDELSGGEREPVTIGLGTLVLVAVGVAAAGVVVGLLVAKAVYADGDDAGEGEVAETSDGTSKGKKPGRGKR